MLTLTALNWKPSNATPDGPAQVTATSAHSPERMGADRAGDPPEAEMKETHHKRLSNWVNTVFHGRSCLEKIAHSLFRHIVTGCIAQLENGDKAIKSWMETCQIKPWANPRADWLNWR